MSVPKCKGCEFHYRSSVSNPRSRNFCDNPKLTHETHYYIKHISGNELSTSPKWCPKRLKESEDKKP